LGQTREKLVLYENNIENIGAKSFAESLVNLSLKSLYLGDNNIGTIGESFRKVSYS